MGKLREKHEMTEHMFVCYNMGTAEERRNPVEETDICAGSSSEQYGITDRQADVAYAMVRYGKPASEIIAEYGVTEEEFTAWVRDGRFSEYASSLARGFAQADAPYIWNSLLDSAKDGNIQAIKLYFDIWNKLQAAKPKESAATADPEIDSIRADIFGDE